MTAARRIRMKAQNAVYRYLQRIAQRDSAPGGYNAVLEVNPDAPFIARALDEGGCDGPLYGWAVLLKDNIATGDMNHTSAGSLALSDLYASGDATVAARLRAAGAVPLGKANMTEFANFMTRGMPSGYSSRGGQVVNPRVPGADPSGSSSGSAAAVAAGLCTAAIGTETSGSILSPAQQCGVVGVKPTIGLVSRTGIFPISPTLDTAGPMAANVADAARLLTAMAGHDPLDPATGPMANRAPEDYAAGLSEDALRGMRIGVNAAPEPSAAYAPQFERLAGLLRELGAELVEIEPIERAGCGGDIMIHEFKAAVNRFLATWGRGAAVRSLGDIVRFNAAHQGAALRYGQTLLVECEERTSGRMIEPKYLAALDTRRAAAERLTRAFDEHNLSLIVQRAGYTDLAPMTGFPAGTVPIGRYDNGVPAGCYLIARPFDERTLLSALYALEQRLRLAPQNGVVRG
ncbi:MAG: amidase [Clostridiales bacterium]|nr:amidase [Clostridiales bacterium]